MAERVGVIPALARTSSKSPKTLAFQGLSRRASLAGCGPNWSDFAAFARVMSLKMTLNQKSSQESLRSGTRQATGQEFQAIPWLRSFCCVNQCLQRLEIKVGRSER